MQTLCPSSLSAYGRLRKIIHSSNDFKDVTKFYIWLQWVFLFICFGFEYIFYSAAGSQLVLNKWIKIIKLQICSMYNTPPELGRNLVCGSFHSKNVDRWDRPKVTSCPFSGVILFKEHIVAHGFIAVASKKCPYCKVWIPFSSTIQAIYI